MTKYLTTGSADLVAAADIINNGGLVAFPTETVYGLGANALDAEAVGRIFTAKGRPADNPLIVHVANAADIYMVASVVSADAEKIIGSLMPGSITIVLPKKNIVPDTVTAGLNTVAVRMPESIAARAFIEQCGVPIAAPSANSSTRPSPTTWQAVKEDMDGKIDAIICGEPCDVGIESTVLDLTGVVPVVLRPGVVTPSEIAKILSKPVKIVTNPTDKVNSPGVRYRHYAPSVPAVLNIDGDSDKIVKFYRQLDTVGVRPVVLCQSDVDVGECETLPLGATDRDVAASIFRQLRAAEKQYDYIIVSYSSTGELSDSILNRLTKSCSGRIL